MQQHNAINEFFDLLQKPGIRSVYKELHADRETGC